MCASMSRSRQKLLYFAGEETDAPRSDINQVNLGSFEKSKKKKNQELRCLFLMLKLFDPPLLHLGKS